MAFVAGGDIWVMDTLLKEPVQITNTPAWETDLVFTKDGKALYFIGQTDGQVETSYGRNVQTTNKLGGATRSLQLKRLRMIMLWRRHYQ